MIKKLIYLMIAGGAILCSSCNDWLNVTPKGQVDANELYATSKGCNSALGGIYYTLSSPELYGKNLTYGAIDILAQYWDLSTNTSHDYHKLYNYDYKDKNSVNLFNTIWHKMYQAITGCNALLYYMPENRGNIEYPELIEGETYALRAFIHMELFEMYGPVIKSKADLQKKALAYRTEFNVKSKEFNTGEEILNLAEQDLKKALELMKDDPIKSVGRKGDSNSSLLDYHEVLNRRGSRANYFCALGLLARLEQLRLNHNEAYSYALRVMEEAKGVIQLIEKDNNLPTNPIRDLNYGIEMLGAIYVNNLYELTNDMFYMEKKGTPGGSISIDNNQYTIILNELYGREPDGSGTDNRLRYWFAKSEVEGTSNYDFLKLHQAKEQQGLSSGHSPEVPIMRMSEIYYIACEANIGVNNTLALKYLNDVRKTRKLEDLLGPFEDDTLREYLVRDARKDMIGEGRIFLMCKRMFYPIYAKAGKIIDPSDDIFTFPIPDNEYEYSNNQKE